MVIAIRKESNGSIYIDKNIYSDDRFKDVDLSSAPYNYTRLEMSDEYSDCISSDFNSDLTFNYEAYYARKNVQAQREYEGNIVALIRKKYTIDQELAILRQRDTKPEEFEEYNAYVEECKAFIKENVNVQNSLA